MKKIFAMGAATLLLTGCAATGELLGAMTVALPDAMANTASQGASSYPRSSSGSYPAPSYPVRRDTSTSAAGIR
eukprot:gene11776-24690_t